MQKIKPLPSKTLWITGINPVKAALLSGQGKIQELIICRTDKRAGELADLGAARGLPVRHEERQVLSAMVGHQHHQGVALRGSEFPYLSIDELLDKTVEDLAPLIILDSLQDPQNLGAILRSACFLGAKHVIIPKDRSAQVTGAVIKVAAGATSYLPVVRVTNLAVTLDQLKQRGLWIIGLDLEGDKSLFEADLSMPLALLVGSEQKGIRPLLRKGCDMLVRIPQGGPMQSLNAATAAAIALAEVQRQSMQRKHF
jgi:23S rRNA (guanosine2251-2'-O)-methyltransferase